MPIEGIININLEGVLSCDISVDENGVEITSVERVEITYPISAVAILNANKGEWE